MRRRTPAAPRLGAASTVALALLIVYAALTLHRASDRRRSTTVATRATAAGDARAAVSVSAARAPADPAAGVTLPLGRAALGPRRADSVGGIVGDGRPAGAGDRPAAVDLCHRLPPVPRHPLKRRRVRPRLCRMDPAQAGGRRV